MRFYTNAFLQRGNIHLRGYEGGRRIIRKVKYRPYLFLPSKDPTSPYRTLDGRVVDKLDFDSIYEAKEFMKRYEDVTGFEYWGLTNFLYTFLYDNYPGEIQFDPSLIRVANIDIETDSSNGFPEPNEAIHPVTAITVKIGDNIVSFAYLDDYKPKVSGATYIRCRDEQDMLGKFLIFWNNEKFNPDVITGWNVEFFDIPYLVNRITRILSEDDAKRLSPWMQLEEKSIIIKGRENRAYVPAGITILDYMHLYKKFSFKNQESYKLDYIAEQELGMKKLEYDGTLHELYEKNFEKFMDYNIHDVILVDKLEQKLKFIEQVFTIAYNAKVNYTDTLSTVRPWDVIIHNYLMDKNIVIPQFSPKHSEQFVGGYVKEPQLGMSKWVVSFDLTSLYPHLIMQYNISPETYRSKLGASMTIEDLLDGKLGEYRDIMKQHNISVAANMSCYTREFTGFLPELMEKMFNDRARYKKLMLEAEREYQTNKTKDLENKIARYKNMQQAIKIQLNSAYGALGNNYFRWFDIRHAEAITTSGQLSIRWIEKKINEYLNKIVGTKNQDYVIASDTDSIYVVLDKLVEKTVPNKTQDEIVKYLDKVCQEAIEPFIDKAYAELADYVNAHAQKMKMKREVIANKGIWKAKKMYILNVHNSEGVQYEQPKLKMMGIEAVRSSTPQVCRKAIKKALELIMNTDEATVQKYIADFRAEFDEMSFEQIAFPRGMNNIDEYHDSGTIYRKGTPIHVKGALIYNHFIKTYNIDTKYPPVYNGDKIKFAYLKMPNPLRAEVISCPGPLPPEFNLDAYVNRDLQFEKTFVDPIKSILDVIGWTTEKKATLDSFFS